MHKSVPLGILTGLLMGLSTTALAASGSVEERLERIEKLLGNQVLMEQMQNMQQVRMELAEIRELVENQEHQLSMIKQRQRNLYQDMDRRLHDLEVGNGGKSSSSSGASKGYSPVQPPSAKSPVAAPVAGTATISTRAPVAPVASDPDGKLAYGQAFNLLKEGRYQQAIIDFRGFIKTYPESKYAANAQYWLGEASYVSRDYKTALIEFQVIINQFPTSNKVQGAALKIGYTFYEMQDWASARTALNNVVIQYPDTTVARKAQERLQRMKREGH